MEVGTKIRLTKHDGQGYGDCMFCVEKAFDTEWDGESFSSCGGRSSSDNQFYSTTALKSAVERALNDSRATRNVFHMVEQLIADGSIE